VTIAHVPAGINLNNIVQGDGDLTSIFNVTSSAYQIRPDFSVQIANGGTDLVLTFTPVPEPTAVLGLAAIALSVGILGRRQLRMGRT
jgi:hypothetical protein